MGLIRHPFNISDILVWSLKDSRNFVFILINILKLQIQEIKGNQATTKQRQVKTSIFLTAQKAGPYVYMFVQLSNTQTELGVCGEAFLRVHIVSNNFASHSAASLGFRASGHRRYMLSPPVSCAMCRAHLPRLQRICQQPKTPPRPLPRWPLALLPLAMPQSLRRVTAMARSEGQLHLALTENRAVALETSGEACSLAGRRRF